MGPNTNDRELMRKLIQNGMDVARFNFSHGDHEEQKGRMDMLKELREEEHTNTAILLDTKGPEIRTGVLKDGKKVLLKEGETITLTNEEIEGDETKVSLTYKGLVDDVQIGNMILIDDGLIGLEVKKIKGHDIVCTVINGGVLSNKKGVNLPGVEVNMPFISPKDHDDILFGIKEGYDFIAASFTRTAADVKEIRDILEKNEDIDLVMLDINMPKIDGFGVLEIMNLRHWISEAPVIIISSESDVDFIRRGYDLGASDYISRPFDLTVVRRRVENTLMLYARQKRLVRLVEEQVYEREKTNNTMINILSHVIEYRNNESGQHILHVRMMTDILLRRLIEITDKYPLTETDISMIASVSALHDIGKISVPKAILKDRKSVV